MRFRGGAAVPAGASTGALARRIALRDLEAVKV
jgi:hypothetical protein